MRLLHIADVALGNRNAVVVAGGLVDGRAEVASYAAWLGERIEQLAASPVPCSS